MGPRIQQVAGAPRARFSSTYFGQQQAAEWPAPADPSRSARQAGAGAAAARDNKRPVAVLPIGSLWMEKKGEGKYEEPLATCCAIIVSSELARSRRTRNLLSQALSMSAGPAPGNLSLSPGLARYLRPRASSSSSFSLARSLALGRSVWQAGRQQVFAPRSRQLVRSARACGAVAVWRRSGSLKTDELARTISAREPAVAEPTCCRLGSRAG